MPPAVVLSQAPAPIPARRVYVLAPPVNPCTVVYTRGNFFSRGFMDPRKMFIQFLTPIHRSSHPAYPIELSYLCCAPLPSVRDGGLSRYYMTNIANALLARGPATDLAYFAILESCAKNAEQWDESCGS